MRTLAQRKNPFVRAGVATVAALSLGVMAGCSETSGDEEGVSVGDVQDEDAAGSPNEDVDDDAGIEADSAYDGAYDAAFAEDYDSYERQIVTLSADVEEIVSPEAFTIAGDDTEALLVVGAKDTGDLDPGSAVEVTGTVRTAFDLAEVEEDTGTDLDDDLFSEWDQEPYLVLESIDMSLDEPEDDEA